MASVADQATPAPDHTSFKSMRAIPTFLLLLPAALSAQTTVLFIGNSYIYSNDLPNMFSQLSASLGEPVTVGSSTPGGYQLLQHASNAQTQAAITARPWDFVVLQEQSQLGALPMEVTTTQEGAALLADAIETNHECTYPVFFMTWGRENGDALNCPDFPFMCTYEGMQLGLRDNYVSLAEANDGYAAPVGWAWKLVRETHPDIDLYSTDGSHPSPAGTYLAACVFHCTLFRTTAVGASYLAGLDATTAGILQDAASTVVLGAMNTWNMDVPNGTDATVEGTTSNGPNVITFLHTGAGTHLWTSSDGQSSTEAGPTFTFAAPGTYTMTHTYTDPCGNTDTVTWTVEIIGTGLRSRTAGALQVSSPAPSMLEVRGATARDIITIGDTDGRVLANERVQGDATIIRCTPGFRTWRIDSGHGRMRSGSILVQ